MSKKIFYISFSLFLVTLFLFLWKSFKQGTLFSKKTIEIKAVTDNSFLENKSEKSEKSGQGEEKDKNKIQKIIDGPIQGAVFSSEDKKILYYSNQNLMQTDLSGQNKESLGAYPFNSVEKINWNQSKEKAFLFSDKGYVLFDKNKGEFSVLSLNTSLLEWGNLNGQFFYQYSDTKNNKKVLDSTFSLSGNPWEVVVDLPYDQGRLLVHPVKNEGLFFPDSKLNIKGDVFKIDFSQKKISKFLDYYKGMDFLFSPSGEKILESYTKKDGRLSLGVVDWETGTFQDLNFPTSVKKCVWSQSEKEVFCAAILSLEKVNLPEDWENKKGSFGDIFWRINIQNGKQERLLDLGTGERTDAENLFLDSSEKNLFFIDRISGGLFHINLLTDNSQPK